MYDNTGGEADFDATLDKINGSNLADLVNPGSGSISAGKFSASLGTPKNLSPMGVPPEGATISNPDVQFFSIGNWGATSGTKGVISMFHESSIARVDYWYVDTDVTITGAESYTYNLTLKAGWNTVITEGTTIKNGVPPAECKWVTR